MEKSDFETYRAAIQCFMKHMTNTQAAEIARLAMSQIDPGSIIPDEIWAFFESSAFFDSLTDNN